jgi:hypothetical protein
MIRYGIDKFICSWISASGNCLRIKKVRKDLASVDFLDPTGAPVQRHYMEGAPSTDMVAHYDHYYEDFEVELWVERRFILHLSHEYDYELDPEHRESLEPALSRNKQDQFLDRYYSLFRPLDHFVREKEQAASNGCTPTTTPKENG